jgi:hypothetical protein
MFDDKGNAVRERCPHCDPEYFAEPFRDPTDNRIYAGPEAMPKMYTRDKDGVYHAKDELIADTVALMDGGPTERAIEHKRRTRRTEPMSKAEIERSNHWAKEVLAPALQNGGMGAVVATLNPK